MRPPAPTIAITLDALPLDALPTPGALSNPRFSAKIRVFRLHVPPTASQDFAVLPGKGVRWHSYILAEIESVEIMLPASMRLRLESVDGFPAKEYRIEDGNVDVRTLEPDDGSDRRSGGVWSRLTPEQLSMHVERNTVVAQWLERRLGWRHLLQACVGQEPNVWKFAHNANHPAL